jgi:hypothetical protein
MTNPHLTFINEPCKKKVNIYVYFAVSYINYTENINLEELKINTFLIHKNIQLRKPFIFLSDPPYNYNKL